MEFVCSLFCRSYQLRIVMKLKTLVENADHTWKR